MQFFIFSYESNAYYKKKIKQYRSLSRQKTKYFAHTKPRRSFQATPLRPSFGAAVGAAPGTNMPLFLSLSPAETQGGASTLPGSLYCPGAFLGCWGDGEGGCLRQGE